MLWSLLFLVTAIHAELCRPDAENAFKVRLSIRSALGDKAYVWGTDEEYLFKAMVAFAMRKVPNRETTEMNRNRINNAFFLDDNTLEFLKIPSTLAPPTDPAVPVWIIVFGVIFCIVIVAIALLVLSGIRQRRRNSRRSPGVEDAEDKCENIITIENSIPYDPLDTKGGHINDGFSAENEVSLLSESSSCLADLFGFTPLFMQEIFNMPECGRQQIIPTKTTEIIRC